MTEPRPSLPVVVLAEAADLVAPLVRIGSPTGPEWLLRTLGWDAPRVSLTADAVGSLATDIGTLLDGLEELIAKTDEDDQLQQAGVVAQQLTTVVAEIAQLPGQVETALAASTDFVANAGLDDPQDGLAIRVVDFLVVRYLSTFHDRLHAFGLLLGLIEYLDLPADPARHRLAATVVQVHWDRLPTLITNPVAVADTVYAWSTAVDHEKLLARVGGVAAAFGLVAGDVEQSSQAHGALGRPADETDELRVPVFRAAEAGARVEAGLLLSDAPAQGAAKKGIGVAPYGQGSASVDLELRPGLHVTLRLAGGAQGGLLLVLRPTGIEAHADLLGTGGNAAFTIKLARVPTGADAAVILAGSATSTRFEAGQVFGSVTGAIDQAGPEFRLEGGLVKGAIVVMPGEGDGFLKRVLPEKGVRAEIDLGLVWSTKTGFHVTGGAGLEVELAVNLSIADVVALSSVLIRIHAGASGLDAVAAVTGTIHLGPIAAVIERIGALGTLEIASGQNGTLGPFTPHLGFKPPSGAGVSIKAGPVTGGGYAFFDPDEEQYAGILQLSFKAISVTAIALLTTRLPDATGPPGATKKGFSLLVIIAVELPPIQLGYGFTLNGVGGLLGVHRTMVVDALRNGVRDGSVNAILFPQDPVKRAAQIISQLRAIFPPAEGRFVFGPMVKIGWGPNAIIELSAALVLELMAPIRLVILGRIQVALPDKKDTVLNLRLDIVGVVDFDRGEVSIDASLVDSRLTAFVLTGDMALRVGWGATKMFALAAGGFHPRFQPPAGFPPLRRLAIALADSDNPRLRMETYLALTANTIQFGAALDASVKMDTFAGTFSVAATFNFDALIQFSPFELMAELGASVDILLNRTPLLHAAVHATLTGPSPWHALGYAEFDFLGKRRIDFEAIAGTPATPPLSEMRPDQVLEQIAEAFSRPDAWVALPPGTSDRIVSVADRAPGAAVIVHPLGALSARQRVLPLGQSINRFGASVVAPTTFTLQGFQLGLSSATTAQAEDLHDDFAPGQFTALTDDERLARPAFETMRSGGRVAAPGVSVPSDRSTGVPAEPGYEEAIVDVEPETGLRSPAPTAAQPAPVPDAALAGLVRAGAAAHAQTRAVGATQFRGPDLGVSVLPERYVLAAADTLAPVPGAAAESSAEATDRLQRRSPAAPAALVVPAREAV